LLPNFEPETHLIHVRRRGTVVKGLALWTFWLRRAVISIGAQHRLAYIARTMAAYDWEKERHRLEKWYAGMVDGELEKLAGEAGSLSDVAREVLQIELSRRGLGIALQMRGARGGQGWPPGPVELRRFRDLPDALLAKSILDSADIECFLIDENIVRMNWLWSNLVGGVKLWIRPEDADAAELLDQDWLGSFVIGGVGEYKQPRCPNCQSFDISFRELIKRAAYASILGMWFAGFIPLITLHRLGWKCHSCGHSWLESDAKSRELQ
jgi:hypothetical protein